MNVTAKYNPKPPIEKVMLEMSFEEAKILFGIFGQFRGAYKGITNDVIHGIYIGLKEKCKFETIDCVKPDNVLWS